MKNHTLGTILKDNLLSYSSYVILNRAVPSICDGLKDVQRKILWAMYTLPKQGTNLTKVTRIVGQAMSYSVHGDKSIGDALVSLAWKNLPLIVPQGNFGDILSGDGAAAARYIEAKLHPFIVQEVIKKDIISFTKNYDDTLQEPITFPTLIPLLLINGASGIAVGLKTVIPPHDIAEVCTSLVDLLTERKKPRWPKPEFYLNDCNISLQENKVITEALIEQTSPSSLIIRGLPPGATTTCLLEEIGKKNSKYELGITKCEVYSAEETEIRLRFSGDFSEVIDKLYRYTSCRTTLHPSFYALSAEGKLTSYTVQTYLHDFLLYARKIRKKELDFLTKVCYDSLQKEMRKLDLIVEAQKKIKSATKTIPSFTGALGNLALKDISPTSKKASKEIIKEKEEQLKQLEILSQEDQITKYLIDYYTTLPKRLAKELEIVVTRKNECKEIKC